jgi:hypothetical protein
MTAYLRLPKLVAATLNFKYVLHPCDVIFEVLMAVRMTVVVLSCDTTWTCRQITFQRDLLPPSSGLKWCCWEVPTHPLPKICISHQCYFSLEDRDSVCFSEHLYVPASCMILQPRKTSPPQ